jgi:stage II sporulation protein D
VATVLARVLPLAAAAALLFAGAASAYFLGSPGGRPGGTTTSTVGSTATTTSATSTTSTLAAPAAVVLSGHGWGHGLGMSQWGANGFARHGWTYDRILAWYYRETTLGPAPVARVRVLLVEGAKRLALGSTAAWRATGADGKAVDLPAGALAVTPALKVASVALKGPVTFAPTTAPLTAGAKPYRGSFVVTAANGKLQLVNAVGVEAYLKGVVSSEMPSSWPAEALKAQAVAARSYALANLSKGAAYDLYSDVRSQVYGGMAAEAAATNAAVDATAGEVVLYDGKVATTYFFSTSGGRTLSALEATGRAIPYLVSVADPYDVASPHHDWGPVVLDATAVAKQLGVTPPLLDLKVTRGASGRVARAAAVSPVGEKQFTGSSVRTLLGLRSTWFTVGWLALTRPPAPMTFGGATTLAGVARGLGAVTLESRPAGGLWQTVGPVTPGANGGFRTLVRPQRTTEYRLAAQSVRAALAKVPVAPRVDATIAAATATGSIRPALAGAPVQLQRLDGTAWKTVGASVTDARGAFSVAGDGAPGSYRVRVAPGQGLVPGLSKTVVA